MSRSLVSLRSALPSDARPRRSCGADVLRRGRPRGPGRRPGRRHRARRASPTGERLVVAEYDGEFAGAVHLRVAHACSPLNLEPIVQALSPHVLAAVPPPRRRHAR